MNEHPARQSDGPAFDGEQYVRDWADYWRKRALAAEAECVRLQSEIDNVREHAREEASALVRNDAWAISFQTMGQYRSALLRALAAPK